MIMFGSVIEVYIVHQGKVPDDHTIYGVFPTRRQAEWYFHAELSLREHLEASLSTRSAFQPLGEDRVFLLGVGPYTLSSDYCPEEERQRLATQWQAWNKLTPEEREVLGLSEPQQIPEISKST